MSGTSFNSRTLIEFQLYFLIGRGRFAGDNNGGAPGINHLHGGIVALGQCPLHNVGVL